MRDDVFVNQASPSLADTQPHRLGTQGRFAVREVANFYEEVIADHERVIGNRIVEIDAERQRSQRFLDWLGEILKLVGGKRDDENVVDAVARYTQHAEAEAGMAAGRLAAAREAFRQLCERHNIRTPCEAFSAPDGDRTPLRPCATCQHPYVMHEPAPETEAVS